MEKINTIYLPALHPGQLDIINNKKRFNVVCCGRRFGKNVLAEDIIIKYLLQGLYVGHAEPTYRMMSEMWRSITTKCKHIIKSIDNSAFRLELNTGGVLELWSLINGDSIRGRRYHLFIINEAAFDPKLEEHWTNIIRPTLTDFKGEAFFFSTPKGDNYFKVLSSNYKKNDEWSFFKKTSYDNPKIDKNEIDMARKDIPEIIFRQEYLAEFVDSFGSMVKTEQIKYFGLDEIDIEELDLTIGVDLAISKSNSADYTAIAVLGRDNVSKNIYIIEIFRNKMSFNETIEVIQNIANKYIKKTKNKFIKIGVESVAYQAAMIQELTRRTNLNVVEIKVSKDKETRFQLIRTRYEQGLVYHNILLIDDFEKELLSFPHSKHDDMVDAVVHAYSLMSTNKKAITYI